MSKKKKKVEKEIQIKVSEIPYVWHVLTDLIQLNDNPFKGNARRLVFKLQPEVKFLQESDRKDIEAVSEKTVKLGEKIPPPTDFPDEYIDTIGKLCTSIPVKESQISKLVK